MLATPPRTDAGKRAPAHTAAKQARVRLCQHETTAACSVANTQSPALLLAAPLGTAADHVTSLEVGEGGYDGTLQQLHQTQSAKLAAWLQKAISQPVAAP